MNVFANPRHIIYVSTVVASLVLTLPAWSMACCGVGGPGWEPKFGAQANIIVWDHATGIEHFVRNASFSTQGKSMGFIAPTPTVPTLAKVDPKAFQLLASLEPRMRTLSKSASAESAESPKSDEPEVIQEVEVAGYTATTVKASDAAGLAKWMKRNGYVTSPGVQEWTDYYIKKKWMLTAFKVSARNGTGETGSVRMSFKTDMPFNPYYVPKENIGHPVGVKLFWLSVGNYLGSVAGKPWVEPTWTADLGDQKAEFAGYLGLKADQLPDGLRVQAYEDRSFPTAVKADIEFTQPQPDRNPWLFAVLTVILAWLGFGFLRRNSRITDRAQSVS
jgi:hypothetical protein